MRAGVMSCKEKSKQILEKLGVSWLVGLLDLAKDTRLVLRCVQEGVNRVLKSAVVMSYSSVFRADVVEHQEW